MHVPLPVCERDIWLIRFDMNDTMIVSTYKNPSHMQLKSLISCFLLLTISRAWVLAVGGLGVTLSIRNTLGEPSCQ